jgi:hypothetical protein
MQLHGSLKQYTIGALLVGSLTVGGAGIALAQDDTTEGVPSHPAHIHLGDCTDLDPNPAAPLNNITTRGAEEDDADEEDTDNAPQGVLTAPEVLYSDSEDIELSFEDDVLASSHSIVVHESEENIQNYIACGEIGGVVVDDGLVISLRPLNDSGYSGIVKLESDDDGNVDVEVFLAEPASTEPIATPAA